MYELKGKILLAEETLIGSYFEDAQIRIVEHNAKGAVGFILNRTFPRKLNELEEFSDAAAIRLHEGGPVNQENLYFTHIVESLGGDRINDDIFFGGDFYKAVKQITEGKLSAGDILIFIGYCGWSENELETEIEEGNWVVGDDIFLSETFP